jgi:rsbT antagonist protein RsbS
MDRIPILKMGEFLLVTIQVDMHDRLAMTLQDDLTASIVKNLSRGVLIDISSVEIVDSFIGRMLGNLASLSRILDAETVAVGMRPSVVRWWTSVYLRACAALNVEREWKCCMFPWATRAILKNETLPLRHTDEVTHSSRRAPWAVELGFSLVDRPRW